ncbi:sulfatase-like hydrolase/transferase [Nocardioides houyundeii]|uniref:sulfatase-like hydrolase/transferase n=1 Tax=Nocardioides houyundeii TaxID=2045452 RepID=UPI000DF174FF|nr:sulfatase-like hydrolase/transferase [Nocardioides houyundeii]
MFHVARSLGALLCAGLLVSALTTASPAQPTRTGPAAYVPATVDASDLKTADRGAGADRDDRPNVIVVLTDDMRADELKQMPRTRALIRDRGMELTDATSPHPLCCPARVELLTGQYGQNNGVRHNESRYGGYHRLKTGNTIGTWFAGQGYNAAFVGKHVNGYENDSPRDPGWNIWEPITGNPTDYFKFRFFGNERYKGDYVTRRIEEKTNSAIRALSAADRPFLLFSNHVAPHERQQTGRGGLVNPPYEKQYAAVAKHLKAPSLSARSYNKRVKGGLPSKMQPDPHPKSVVQKKWQARVRSLQSVDAAVASMVDALTASGELDNTYLVFTSDNGYSLGERRLQKKNNLVNETLRVPLVIAGPGIAPGSRSPLPVTLVDLVATITDLTDVQPTLTTDGASFAPTLRGADQWWRDTTLIQTGYKYNPATDRKLKHKGWALRGVRTERYTYARDMNTGEKMLFDRQRDPWELKNVVDTRRYARVVAELERRAGKLRNCNGDNCNRTFGRVPKPRKR